MRKSRVAIIAFLLCGVLFLLGCGDKRVQNVKTSADFARRMLEKTKTDTMASIAFASSAEQGGNVITYITANIAEPEGFASYIWIGPPAPYSVVIRPGSTPGEYIIEGYTDTTNKPFSSIPIKDVGSKRPN